MAGSSAGVADPRTPGWLAPIARASAISARCGCIPTSSRRDPPRGGAAVVHGAVWPRQPDHELPSAALPARAGRDHPAGARRPPGHGARRLPGAGAGQDPARAALRRAHRARGATAFPVLRDRRRHAAVPRSCWTSTTAGRATTTSCGALEPNARAALAWIEDSGDADGDGYVEYACRNPATGLVNQCWKDSWDAIQFADGTLARGPIATCEIQGYVYDAQRRAPDWPARCGTMPRSASDSSAEPPICARRFRRDFWMPERGCHALALDGDKRQVDSLTSNIGHLLWSGLLDEDEAATTAERLLDEQLYSGWGVRTLGAREAGYNPLGYHTGTVWPHENSLIAAGLARYGHREAANTIAVRDSGSGTPLRAPPARGVRRLPRVGDIGPRRVPDGLASASLGRRNAAAAAHDAARPHARTKSGAHRHRFRDRRRHTHSRQRPVATLGCG